MVAGRFGAGGAGMTGARDGLVFVERSGCWPARVVYGGQANLLLPLLCLLFTTTTSLYAQRGSDPLTPGQASTGPTASSATIAPEAQVPGLRAWEGLRVAAVQFQGVDASVLDPL